MGTSKQKSQLYDDSYYAIAENLFFNLDYGNGITFTEVDMRVRNVHTNFMCLCPATRNAVLSQFAKMKKIKFENSWKAKGNIELFKNGYSSDCSSDDDDPNFEGPFLVNGGFVYNELILAGKFKCTHIIARNVLEKFPPKETKCCHSGKTNLQILCNLFLQKSLPASYNEQITIEKLDIEESVFSEGIGGIGKRIEELLALDAKKVKFKSMGSNVVFDCSAKQRKIIAEKTNKITFNCTRYGEDMSFVADFPENMRKWKSMVDYLSQSCRNLRKLKFTFELMDLEYNMTTNEICDFLLSWAEITTSMLGQLSAGNSELNLEVNVITHLENYEVLPLNAYPMFRLGDLYVPLDEPERAYITQKIVVKDQASRNHKFGFIFIDDFDAFEKHRNKARLDMLRAARGRIRGRGMGRRN